MSPHAAPELLSDAVRAVKIREHADHETRASMMGVLAGAAASAKVSNFGVVSHL